ncbi:cardioacceleratory peptide receptor-like, partial [Liolophura sinensis]|uniref:cardioacceleratory peptide receptor-like n=1 Tax=Liolophura sinensis TaxID=3198878 RepID=UPI003158399D
MDGDGFSLGHAAYLLMVGNFTGNLTSAFLNGSTGGEDTYYFYQTEQVTFLCILLALIVCGNSAVLVAILKSKRRSSRMNFFIINLAIADLSVGLLNVLPDTIWKITVEFMAGDAVCRTVRYMQGVVTYASTYVLVALSIDRLDVIARPMYFTRAGARSKWLIGTAWTISFLFALPMTSINELVFKDGIWQCWINFPEHWHWKLYITLIAIVLFILPAIFIAICYIVIVLIIWNHGTVSDGGARFARKRLLPRGDSCESCRNGNIELKQASSSRGVIPKAKIKTIKMTLTIVTVFICCWSPFFVFDLLDVYGHIPMSQEKVAISTFIQSLAPLNSAANPVIYTLFNTKICRAVFSCQVSSHH